MTEEDDYLDKVRLSLPPFLAAKDKQALVAQIREHVANRTGNPNYFAVIPGITDPIQGDGWSNLSLFEFDTGNRSHVLGLVVSNSCDLQTVNRPHADQRLVFAPVLDLARYCELLRTSGQTAEQVAEFLRLVRRQEIHRIFYLPEVHGQYGESIVPLDAVHSQPLRSVDHDVVNRRFSLNNFGWYMLLLKLSIHFMRMQEGLNRSSN